MNCLFCNGQEKNYKPEPNTDYICGSCVQLLFKADQDDLQKAQKKALEKGYLNKARTIESFLIPEDDNEQRKQRKPRRRSRRASGKTVDRKRVARTFRRK